MIWALYRVHTIELETSEGCDIELHLSYPNASHFTHCRQNIHFITLKEVGPCVTPKDWCCTRCNRIHISLIVFTPRRHSVLPVM